MKTTLKYLISLVFAGTLLWYTFKDYDFTSNFEQLKSANWWWVLLAGVLTLLAHISRAIRWKMLLKPIGFEPSTTNTTLSVLMGYFANYLFPRLGEVTRCGTLNTIENIPIEKSFGTVVTERIVDVIFLLTIFALNFILEFDRLADYFLGFFIKKNSGSAPNYYVFGLIILLFLGLAWLFWQNKANILNTGIGKKISKIFGGFSEGLMSIFKLDSPILFLAHSIFIWFCYYLTTYVMFFALPQSTGLGKLAALSTLTSGALGIAAPTPGGVGAYHALVSNLLTVYGLNINDGKTLAIFLHGGQMIITVFSGIVAFFWLFLKKKQ